MESDRNGAAAFDFRLEVDRAVDLTTGLLCEGEGVAVNFEPVPVRAGDSLCLADEQLEYRLAFYRETPDPRLLYTYAYQPEANWAMFCPERSDAFWKTEPTVFSQNGYIRVMLRRLDHAQLPERLPGAVRFQTSMRQTADPVWIHEELSRVMSRVQHVKRDGDAVFLLLSDTHYAIGCNWADTLSALAATCKAIAPHGVIHLGDLTDGLLPETWTMRYAGRVLDGLRSLGSPCYICLGNHDSNYFKKNGQTLSGKRRAQFYLNRRRPWYFKDLPEQKLRLFFLDTFDPAREQRYGFSRKELCWLRYSLMRTPSAYRVLLFSHVPPLAQLHVWSNEILNERAIMRILAQYQARGGKVLGWIHGHNHADQLTAGPGFPVVSVGCGKTEAFAEHKPRGSVTYDRRLGEASQELWDVLILHANSNDFDLIRYGAGTDRHIEPVYRG